MNIWASDFSPFTKYGVWVGLLVLTFCVMPVVFAQTTEPLKTGTSQDKKNVSPAQSDDKEVSSEDDGSSAAVGSLQKGIESLDQINQLVTELRQEISSGRELSDANLSSVQQFEQSLRLVGSKLKETQKHLETSQTGIQMNANQLGEFQKELEALVKQVKDNDSALAGQQALIEDNSIRVYELLIQLNQVLHQQKESVKKLESRKNLISQDDKAEEGSAAEVWALLTGLIGLLSLLCFVWGQSTSQNASLLNNIMLGILAYITIGFGVMYGATLSGWIGVEAFLFQSEIMSKGHALGISNYSFLFLQLGKVAFVIGLVNFLLQRYLSPISLLMISILMAAVILPIFGHWLGASLFNTSNKGWLEGAGVIDNSAGLLLHLIPVLFASYIVWRIQRVQSEEEMDVDYSAPMVVMMGLVMVSFTVGGLGISSHDMGKVMINLMLGAAAGSVLAKLNSLILNRKAQYTQRGLYGFVSGLVATSMAATLLTPLEAICLGAVSGLMIQLLMIFFRGFALSTAYKVILVTHVGGALCGILGVAFFGTEGSFSMINSTWVVTQVQGLAAAIGVSLLSAQVVFTFIRVKKTRVS